MLIEVHMIQNYNPANLNRDDLGAPKTAIFGGVTRARISSQCLKRSIRRSPEFAAALERAGGVRTRRLSNLLARVAASGDFDLTPAKLATLLAQEPVESEAIRNLDAIAATALEKGGIKAKAGRKEKVSESGEEVDEGDSGETLSKMLLFLSTRTIAKMARDLKEESDPAKLVQKFKGYIAEDPRVPDIALCGRMTEVSGGSAFSGLNFGVEAALSAAHAISTHAVVNEVDYFTAADDLPGADAGAGHVNEAVFNSACFYKHFIIDFEQLKRNLGGDADLAGKTVRCFLEAAAKAHPTGKQHAFAAFNPPDGVLVEVKGTASTAVSYANAFADPVPENALRGLVGESIARLGQYVHDIATGYGIEAERFWFSPNLRYRLTWIDKSKKDDEQEQAVDRCSDFGSFSQFVAGIMSKIAASQNLAWGAK